MSRSTTALGSGLGTVFKSRRLDRETLDSLEELLIASDFGVATAERICGRLAEERFDQEMADEDVKRLLCDEICRVVEPVARGLEINPAHKPHIVLVVGVNGTGKTTTIGQLARNFKGQGLRVMLAAGDTFRAAAIEQLRVWGDRTQSPVIAKDIGADAAGLVFEAVEAARREQMDVLLIDTAGRLQNKAHLMAELEKIIRVIRKIDAAAPHSVILVLDATTGQNALTQVEAFKKAAPITGLIMTKLDGTAKGGILVALTQAFELPIHAIGVGEAVEDLQPFDPRLYAEALTGVHQSETPA